MNKCICMEFRRLLKEECILKNLLRHLVKEFQELFRKSSRKSKEIFNMLFYKVGHRYPEIRASVVIEIHSSIFRVILSPLSHFSNREFLDHSCYHQRTQTWLKKFALGYGGMVFKLPMNWCRNSFELEVLSVTNVQELNFIVWCGWKLMYF